MNRSNPSVTETYPLLKRAQELGAPFEVGEPDENGDFYVVFDKEARVGKDNVWLLESLEAYEQYILMGLLMDWLGTLREEVKCLGCDAVQKEMAQAWGQGGFLAMLKVFNRGVVANGIDHCAEELKSMRAVTGTEPDSEEPPGELAAARERIESLERELAQAKSEVEAVTKERDGLNRKLSEIYRLSTPGFRLGDLAAVITALDTTPYAATLRGAVTAEEAARVKRARE